MSESSSASGPSKTSRRTCVASSARRAAANVIIDRHGLPADGYGRAGDAVAGHALARLVGQAQRDAQLVVGRVGLVANQVGARALQPAASAIAAETWAWLSSVLKARLKPGSRTSERRTATRFAAVVVGQRPADAVPQAHIPALAAVVQQAGDEQIRIVVAAHAQCANHVQPVTLVCPVHRVE